MTTTAEIDALETELLNSPEIAAEVDKLMPTLQRMKATSFVALSIALRQETARRVGRPPQPVRVGNR